MIIFEFQYEAQSPRVKFELPPCSTIPEVVEQFELFLKAAGYHFEGHFELIGEDEVIVENDYLEAKKEVASE